MVLLHVGLGVLISLLHLFIFYALIQLGIYLRVMSLHERYDFYALVYRWLGSNMYIYIGIVGFLHFFYFYRQHREKELRASQLETQMVEIQLQSLKTQLQPHFLFNALNTISAYVRKNPDIAIKMTARLSDLLRLTLETKTQMEIPLREELKIVSNYLEIERLRFADRMEVKLDIAPDTEDALVPALLLQPLAENAVRHGISRKIVKGTILISTRYRDGKLELRVEDDGMGMKETTAASHSGGIGLRNLRERLDRLYGEESAMVLHSQEGRSFAVKITLPVRKV